MKDSGLSFVDSVCVPRNAWLHISKWVSFRGFLVMGISSKFRRTNAVRKISCRSNMQTQSLCPHLWSGLVPSPLGWAFGVNSWSLELGLLLISRFLDVAGLRFLLYHVGLTVILVGRHKSMVDADLHRRLGHRRGSNRGHLGANLPCNPTAPGTVRVRPRALDL